MSKQLWITKVVLSRLRPVTLGQRMTLMCGSTHMFFGTATLTSELENSYWPMEVRDQTLTELDYQNSPVLEGYPLSPFVLTPFARNERLEDGERKVRFGKLISGARVVIERTFGRLKIRFPSLVMMGDVEDLGDLYRAIEAMMVIHNICFDLHDTVSGLADGFTQLNMVLDGNLYNAVGQEPADMDWGQGVNIHEPLLEAGRAWRMRCMDLICPE